MMKRTRTMLTFVSILFLVFGLSACGPEEEKDSDAETAPTLPPESSMVMDFSDFTDSSTATKTLNMGYELQSHILPAVTNYGYAATKVWLWNTVLWVNMAVPVAAFRQALLNTPRRQSDGTWVWTYTVTVGNDVYTASLHGKVVETNVNWTMYITKDGVYADTEWFTGTSALDGTGGTWALNYSTTINTAPTTPLLNITWSKDATADTLELRFTSKIAVGKIVVDDYVEYAVTGNSPYDARYHIYIEDALTQIEWNRESKAGRITDPVHYEHNDWYCWDSGHGDTTCPAP